MHAISQQFLRRMRLAARPTVMLVGSHICSRYVQYHANMQKSNGLQANNLPNVVTITNATNPGFLQQLQTTGVTITSLSPCQSAFVRKAHVLVTEVRCALAPPLFGSVGCCCCCCRHRCCCRCLLLVHWPWAAHEMPHHVTMLAFDKAQPMALLPTM